MKKIIKSIFIKYYITLSLLLIFNSGYSQFDLQTELEKAVKVPNSPEASAFTKYGDETVNLYTGVPNIQIPIHNIKGRELDLPISLSYDATGIKVEQLSTQVGLGWNLNIGGRISRITNGAPDDFIYSNPEYFTIWDQTVKDKMISYLDNNHHFSTPQKVVEYFNFLKDANIGKYDTQADYFSLDVIGINDYIVFDLTTGIPKTLNNPRIKVTANQDQTASISSWIVTNEDGIKFYFDQAEETYFHGDDTSFTYGMVKTYNSSWLLTKIESANKKDVYDLNYINLGYWSQPEPTTWISSHTTNASDYNNLEDTYPISAVNLTYYLYKIKQKFLSTVYYNGIKQVEVTLKERQDITVNSAIDKITLYHLKSTEEVFNTYTFNHSYFGNPSSIYNYDKRLKLESIQITAPNTSDIQSYLFEYESPLSVPPTNSLSQDYLGYYNGAQNFVLYPKKYSGLDLYEGANRYPDFNYAKNGVLTKITHPTKGYSVFEYEPHKTLYDGLETLDEAPTVLTIAATSLNGGFESGNFSDPNTECNGSWCQDMFMNPPKVTYATFKIEEAGYKDVSYIRNLSSVYQPAFVQIIKTPTPPFTSTHPCPIIKLKDYMDLNSGTFISQNNVIGDYSNGFTGSVYFDVGCYQVTIVDGALGSNSTVTISEKKRVLHGVVGKGEFARAGIRIKSIKNYSEQNVLALEKNYQYTSELDGSDSSGEIIFNPMLSYTSTHLSNNSTNGIVTIQNLNRINTANGGDSPHVGYSKVYEIKKSVSDPNINGYVEYNFNNNSINNGNFYGIHTNSLPPHESYYSKNYILGKERLASSYSENNTKLTDNEYTYIDNQYYINESIFIKHNPNMAYKYPKIIQENGLYTYQFINATIAGGVLMACTEPGCINDSELASLEMRICPAYGRIGNTSKVSKTEYFSTGNVLQTEDNTYYDATNYFLLSEKIVNMNSADELKTKYYYPANPEMVNESVTQNLISENKVAKPLKTEKFSNGLKVYESLYKYASYPSSVAGQNLLLPQYVYAGKENNSEKKITFDSYDTKGNILQYTPENGIPTSFIWGYNKTLPIAKIENATITQVSAALGMNLSDITEANMSTINALRSSLPNAMISTYTHIPLVGVSTITDPKGDTMTYIYDSFNRLQEVNDKNGNKLSENQYHYRP